MKTKKYIHQILYNNGYTIIPSNIEFVNITSDGYLIFINESGNTMKAGYDTTSPVSATTSIIAPTYIVITTGQTYQLDIINDGRNIVTRECTFISSDITTATVDSTGKILGIAVGSCTITVYHPVYDSTLVITIEIFY